MSQDLIYQLALSLIPGINITTAGQLLEKVDGDIRSLFECTEEHLRALMGGIRSRAFDAQRMQQYLQRARKEAEFVTCNGIEAVFFQDKDRYPTRLGACNDAPVVLYKLGSCDLDSAHMVAVVGTRHATAYGLDFTRKLVLGLADAIDSLVIVSGLAYGIDVASHRAAIEAGVPTVAVNAQPLNTIYPAVHREVAKKMVHSGGAMVSEYSTGSRVTKGNFLSRNRIIAGLCDAVVVVESDLRGGAMATARMGADYGRDIFSVPGRVGDKYSNGCNHLIATDIAHLITSADDIIDLMRWIPRAKEGTQQQFPLLSPEDERLLDTIRAYPEFTVNDLAVKLNTSYTVLTEQLFKLEMENYVVARPGQRYQVVAP